MDFKQALRMLEQSKNFRTWHNKNKSTYFSFAFKIPEETGANDWQLGFCNSKNDKVTTFVIADGKISIRAEEEVFKREETKVGEIEINKINLTFGNAIAKANEFQSKNFPKDKSIKTIVILQNIPNFGNMWNITYVTESFNTLNIKIDALNGKIVEHNLASVLSFRKE